MIYNFETGDMVTVKQAGACATWGSTEGAVTARQPGLKVWDVWIPRSSIMTIIKITTPSVQGIQTIATVLHNGQMFEMFANDLQRLPEAEQ